MAIKKKPLFKGVWGSFHLSTSCPARGRWSVEFGQTNARSGGARNGIKKFLTLVCKLPHIRSRG